MTRTYQTFDEGRLDVLGQRYGEVIDALESSTNIPLWYHCVPRSMQCGMPGMDRPLARFAAGALRVLPEMPTPLRALALALRGWEELSAGKVAVAAASVELADSDARWLGPPPNVRVFVYALLPMLHALYGRAAEARSALDELMKTFDDPDVGYRPGSFVHIYYCLHGMRIADLLGDAEGARALLAEIPDDPRPLNTTMQRVLASHRAAARARLAAHDGRADEAVAAYAEALADADALSVYGQTTEVRLRLALVLLGLGRVADAAASVEQALAATARDGQPGAGVLMLGAANLRALAGADWQGRLPEAAIATLRAWATLLPVAAPPAPRSPGVASSGTGALAAPAASPAALSPRELEVLRHIAAGDSNKLIARAFDLSPHTVKRHVANILDKLVLQSRGQAAAWYRQHAAQAAE